MKRLKKIVAASEPDSKLDSVIDNLEDDFDYIISGLEKLQRIGIESEKQAVAIAEDFAHVVNNVVLEIATRLSE